MTRGRYALLAAAPLLLLLVGQIAACRIARRPDAGAEDRLQARAAELSRSLDVLLGETGAVAARARDRGVDAADDGLRPALRTRLEGTGVLRSGRFESWAGTPAEAGQFPEPGDARIVSRGIRTSLLVRSVADGAGRTGVASFVLELSAGGIASRELLPDARGLVAHFVFDVDPGAVPRRFDPGPPATLATLWRSTSGRTLAELVVEETPPSSVAARVRAQVGSWAAVVFVLALIAALARKPAPVDARRAAALVAAVVAGRWALAAAHALDELTPRSIGSASLYGRGDALGLFASPAALLATSFSVFLLLWILARHAEQAPSRDRARAGAGLLLGAAAAVAGTLWLAGSLVRDAQVRVPRLSPSSAGALMLSLGAACWIAGCAEALAALALLRRPRAAPTRWLAAALLVPCSLLFLAQSYRVSERLVRDHLRSDFAPLVLEQTARRRSALLSTVREAAGKPLVTRELLLPPDRSDPSIAYDLWIASDLFHEGFASSLDLYDHEGTRRAHFGFAFPEVGGEREASPRVSDPRLPPVLESEMVPAGATRLRVFHAEAAVARAGGGAAGRVVGHVLEDPGNLAFLPGNAPYIDALSGEAASDTNAQAPDYVLFDADGRVVLSTLHQPPAISPAIRQGAGSGRTVDVTAGDTRYHALALTDGPRVHLLLVPAPTALGVLADGVRLMLLGLVVIGAARLVGTLAAGGRSRLTELFAGSFHRRLLATVLLASVVPLIGLSVFLRAYIDRRGEASLAEQAAALVGAARRVVEDYQSVGEEDPTVPPLRINDQALWWLRRVVGQEIHVYEDGILAATSKPELFDSALLLARLPGEVDREVVRGRQPFVVRRESLGSMPIPVAYARLDLPGGPRTAVIAVPLVIEQRAFARSVDRLIEMLLLVTTALVGLLAISAAWIARSVGDPVRRLASASRRIAGGDYGVRLTSSSRDEMGSLVSDFNSMAKALAGQRADIERRRDYIEALLRHATTGVISTDASGRIVTINPAAHTLLATFGMPPERGEPLLPALAAIAALAPLSAALEDRSGARSATVEVDLPAGEETLRLRVVRVSLPGGPREGPGSLFLIDDVTSLMKSNQLAAWAEMARAIAHEIKNPLTPIQLSAEHVQRLIDDGTVPRSAEVEACLETIVRNVRELRDISGAFSTYAKLPDLDLAPVDPGSFLADVTAPYRAAPPPGISIVVENGPAPAMMADRKVLARAIVNLIENAIQAMPSGGRLLVSAGEGAPGEVVLAVEDTGTGLTPDARARLFEPYFSTKSSGTGLGLAIVRRIVLGHGGTIEVVSSPGQGATFRVRLRAAPDILRA